ncbi:hypothetical protein CDEF62S_03639 [Castellaniella defragrans]
MQESSGSPDSPPPSPRRRRLLAGFVGAYTATLVPWALAQPVRNDRQGSFLALSAIIAGRQSLNADMADRIFEALGNESPDFPADAADLLQLIEERSIAPLQLQQVLDGEKSRLAALPRKIATAWLLGVIGTGKSAYVIAYEHALNAQMVADVLKPPTYAYGPYGSWTRNPL